MTTANELANAALKLLNVASNISPPTPDQQEEAFIALKDMLASWEKDGVDIEVFIPYRPDEELDEPEWTTKHIKRLLAKELAPIFQVEPSEGLKTLIEDSEGAIQIHAVTVTDPVMQGTLPRGAGNRRGPNSRTYFSENTTS